MSSQASSSSTGGDPGPAPLFSDAPEPEAPAARAPKPAASSNASTARKASPGRRNMALAMDLKAHLQQHWLLGREGFRAHLTRGYLEDLAGAAPEGQGENPRYDTEGHYRRRVRDCQETMVGYAAQRLRTFALMDVARRDAPVGRLEPKALPERGEEGGPAQEHEEHRLSREDFTPAEVRRRARRAASSEDDGADVSFPEPLLSITGAGEWALLEQASGPHGYGNDVMKVFGQIWKRGRQRRFLSGAAQRDPDAAWDELKEARQALFGALTEASVLPEVLRTPVSSASDLAPVETYAAAGVIDAGLLTPEQQRALSGSSTL